MRLVLLVLCLLFLASLSVAESTTLEAKEGPATQETKESIKALEQTPAQEATQKSISKTPLEGKKESVLLAEGSAAAKGLGKDPATSPEKGAEATPKVSKEAKKQPAGQKSVKKSPSPESEPKVAEKGDTGALFSVEEGEKAHEEQVGIHEMVPEKAKDGSLFSVEEAEKVGKEQTSIHEMMSGRAEDESLFSVEKAEKAGKEQTSIHEMMSKKAEEEKDVSLFSVEKAEKAAGRPTARPKIKARRPLMIKPRAEREKKEARREAPVTRRKVEKKKDDWVKIELGFAYKNIQLFQGSYTFESHFIGEMVNETGRDFGIVKFMFSAYDRRGKLISEEPFQITDFYDGQIKTFKGTVIDGYKDVASHKVRFLSGAPTAGG